MAYQVEAEILAKVNISFIYLYAMVTLQFTSLSELAMNMVTAEALHYK